MTDPVGAAGAAQPEGAAQTANAAQSTNFGARRESLRDTAKWVLGTVGALLAAVLATAPLAQVAELQFDARGRVAALGLVAAAIGCGWLLNRATAVLATKVRSWQQILTAKDKPAKAARAETERLLADSLPEEISTLASLGRYYEAALGERLAGRPSGNFASLSAYVDYVADLFLLVEMRRRFDNLMRQLYFVLPVVIVGMLAFAWGAGAPKEPTPLDRPYPISVPWKAENDAVLAATGLGQACYKPILHLLGVSQLPGGRVLVASVPSPNCPTKPLILVGSENLVAASW